MKNFKHVGNSKELAIFMIDSVISMLFYHISAHPIF